MGSTLYRDECTRLLGQIRAAIPDTLAIGDRLRKLRGLTDSSRTGKMTFVLAMKHWEHNGCLKNVQPEDKALLLEMNATTTINLLLDGERVCTTLPQKSDGLCYVAMQFIS